VLDARSSRRGGAAVLGPAGIAVYLEARRSAMKRGVEPRIAEVDKPRTSKRPSPAWRVGCSIGISPGFVPLRMRSTKYAGRAGDQSETATALKLRIPPGVLRRADIRIE
jgi:hypothetical protein